VITDRNSRVVAVAAGPPAEGGGGGSAQSKQSFVDACGDFAGLLLPYGSAKQEKDGRRGSFAAVNFGLKLGPGHQVRAPLRFFFCRCTKPF
jgi:hypothetical protein